MAESETEVLVPPSGAAIDWEHLRRATLADAQLAEEVLLLFHKHAGEVAAAIRDLPSDTSRLAHGLKGSARSLGAGRVADAAQKLERALSDPAVASIVAAELVAAIQEVRDVIDRHLRESRKLT